MRNLIVYIFSALILLSGCSDPSVNRQLETAEAVMEQHPDSALTILQAIDGSRLRGEQRARHALLLSQAYDKNYIDLTSDSLISIATDYYADSDDDYHKMLAYHYRGTVYKNADSYGAALIDGLRAHDIATELNDTLNLARTESLIARMFIMGHEETEAYKWDLLCLQHDKMCQNLTWLSNTYLNIGNELLGMRRDDEAMLYADSAIAISDAPYIIGCAQEIKYLSYFMANDTHKSDSLYNILQQIDYEMSDNVVQSRKHLENRNPEDLIKFQESIIEEQNNYILAMTVSNMSEARQQFEREKADKLKMAVKEKRKGLAFLAIFSGLIIATLIVILRFKHLHDRARYLKKENQAQALIKDYERLQSTYEITRLKVGELNQDVKALTQQSSEAQLAYEQIKQEISLAFLQQFSWIEKFGELYIQACLHHKRNNAVIKQFEDSIIFKPHLLINEIEQQLKKNNTILLEQINGFKLNQTDKEMLYFFIIGISTRVICLVTDKTPASIYNIKSRIKKRLLQLDSPLAKQILSIL